MDVARRKVLTGGAAFAALCAVPRPAIPQSPRRVYSVGCLWAVTAPVAVPFRAALADGLRQLGWIEGQNIVLEHRFPRTAEDFPAFAQEIVKAGVDVIVAATNRAILPAARATPTIPIVMMWANDPVGDGYAVTLAKPGKNLTGITNITSPEFFAKHVELTRELRPNADLLSVLTITDPTNQSLNRRLPIIETMARKLGLRLDFVSIATGADVEGAFEKIARSRSAAVYVGSNGLLFSQLPLIARLGVRHRIPTIFYYRDGVEAGGLMSYGQDSLAIPRAAAAFVDKILRGAKPGDLPIEQPTRFELVLNRKTAKAIGLTIPALLLLRADHVIE